MVQVTGDGKVKGSFQIGYCGITFNVTYTFPSPSSGSPKCAVSPQSGGGLSMTVSQLIGDRAGIRWNITATMVM